MIDWNHVLMDGLHNKITGDPLELWETTRAVCLGCIPGLLRG